MNSTVPSNRGGVKLVSGGAEMAAAAAVRQLVPTLVPLPATRPGPLTMAATSSAITSSLLTGRASAMCAS